MVRSIQKLRLRQIITTISRSGQPPVALVDSPYNVEVQEARGNISAAPVEILVQLVILYV